jgi:alpha 1,3-mannosyltransferase
LSTVLQEVLDSLILEPALEFRPDGKDTKDLDIGHIARHTAVLKDLLRIHERISPITRELQLEKESFQDTIEALQQTLYPWITQPTDGNRTYTTFFELIDSFTEDAGIVITTGVGGFRWTVHQIVTLRVVLNSTLPIEVFYGGDDDLPEPYRDFLHLIESSFPNPGTIKTIDITEKFPDPDEMLGLPGGWAMRPFAMLASSFKTVILTDADSIFLQDPRKMLDEANFQEFGSVFWHDRILSPASEETYKWADELLEVAKAKHLDKSKAEGWFGKKTFYEMERYNPKGRGTAYI